MKTSWKQLVAFNLVVTIIFSFFYLPIYQERVMAQIGASANFTVADVPRLVERIIDGVAMTLAQTMIDSMVKSTITWAQNGFEGNPAYVTDPEQYFSDIADGVAGNFIYGSRLNFLCSPFQAQVRLALQRQYVEPNRFQCTLTQVVQNIDAFYNDFNQGGLDAWFSMTQNDVNNPYGAYLLAKTELDSQIASAVGLKREQLNINQGFLSWSECEVVNPPPGIPSHVPGIAEGECVKRGPIQTPGSIIQGQLNEVLPSGLKKLQVAQNIDQLISAFASGLLNRYVFGSRGLFARRNGPNSTASFGANLRTGMIDLDNDGLPDGQDLDQDGKLESAGDVCFHGGTPAPAPAAGCSRSGQVTNSPYFAPLCQATTKALGVLDGFRKFVDANRSHFKRNGVDFHDRSNARVWGNRAMEVDSAVNEVLTSIQSYHSPFLDTYEIGTNRFAFFTNVLVTSLLGDGWDLDFRGGIRGGVDPEGTSFRGRLSGVRAYISENVTYFQRLKSTFGNCSNPNFTNIRNITPPPSFFGYCATPEQVSTFLAANPNGDLAAAFPCYSSALPGVADDTFDNDTPDGGGSLAGGSTALTSAGLPQGSGITASGVSGVSGVSGTSGTSGGGGDSGSTRTPIQGSLALGTPIIYEPIVYDASTGYGGRGGESSDSLVGSMVGRPTQQASDNTGIRDPGVGVATSTEKTSWLSLMKLSFSILLLLIILIILWLIFRRRNRNNYE